MTTATLLVFCFASAFSAALFTFIVMDERRYHFGADEYWRGHRHGMAEARSRR